MPPESALSQDTPPREVDPATRARNRRRARVQNALRLAGRLATWYLRPLPDFLIIGAAKAGTSALFRYLEAHPQVVPPLRKEVYFFDRTWRRGRPWYRAFFPTRARLRAASAPDAHALTGESTPDYLFHPHAAARIRRTLPGARLILLLRDPVDLAFSFWTMMVDRGRETLSFEDALAAEEGRLAGEWERMLADPGYHSSERQQHAYVARGRFLEQIERWLEVFPREQLLILLAEDLKRDPARTLREATDFLGLPPIQLPEYRKVHPGRYRETLGAETRARLGEVFRPHNRRLAEFLGRALPWTGMDQG